MSKLGNKVTRSKERVKCPAVLAIYLTRVDFFVYQSSLRIKCNI